MPPIGMLTAVNVSVWLFFFNDAVTSDIYALTLHDALPISSATLDSESLLAAGASLTSVTLKLTVAVLLFGSAEPLVVPLSVMVYWKLAAPLNAPAGQK